LNPAAVDDYSIRLPDFEGPLDLLLQLIEHRELDITRVSLAVVADQYLDFITRPGNIELSALADYLVIAAKLILAKSRLLLPHAETDSGEPIEDSAEALARQLRQYKIFKQVAQHLRDREQRGLHSYPRRTPPPRPTVARTTKIEGLSFDALYTALRRSIEANPPLPAGTLIEPLRVSIQHRIQTIRELTQDLPRVRFTSLLAEAQTRVEVIVTFLAVLESVKRKLISTQQDELFGEIYLIRRATLAPTATHTVNEDDETEFTGA
jgi:segregation and condensation protein A